jgi:uncharacterized protein (TIGR02271 family)
MTDITPLEPAEDHNAGRSPDPGQVAVTRSEEHLSVRTIRTPTERVRIRKVIITEERTVTIPVRREEVLIEREPLAPGTSGSSVAAHPITIILHAEEPVISTRVIPVERVHVLVDTITQMTSVTDNVRAERVEIRQTITEHLDNDDV